MNTITSYCIGFAAFIFFIIIYLYNSIISNRNAVVRSWSDVITYERNKNHILPKLEELLLDYKSYESSLQMKIVELRTAINAIQPASLDINELNNIENKTRCLAQGIKVALENYPELKASQIMQQVINQITKQQENIAASLSIFNKNVEEFNNYIQIFPANYINKILNKESLIKPFVDKQALSGFEYNLNID